MLIEFFGLPGSGKSSISRQVAKMLVVQGLQVDEITYDIDHRHRRPARLLFKLVRFARYAGTKPRQALFLWAKLAATRQETMYDLAREAMNCMFIASLAPRRGLDGKITLLDQGIAQALWSVGYAARHEAWLDLVLDGCEQAVVEPDMVIHVRAGIQTIRTRLSRRNPHVSRLEHDLGSDDHPLLIAQANSDAVLSRLAARGIAIVEVSNDHPEQLDLNAQLVASTITLMLRRERALRPQQASLIPMGAPSAECR